MHPLAASRILAPVDFSPASKLSAQAAAELARAGEATLTVLYVRPTAETLWQDTAAPESPERVTRRMAEIDERLATWAKDLRAPNLETRVRNGDVVRQILEVAKRHDLVVMASHGRRELGDLLLGSTTERVVRAAPCSVLVVRPEMDA